MISAGWPETRIDKMRNIVETRTLAEVDGVMIDVQTANAYVTVWNSLRDETRAKLDGFPMEVAGNLVWDVVTRR